MGFEKYEIHFTDKSDNSVYVFLRDWCKLVEENKNKLRTKKLERILNVKVDK